MTRSRRFADTLLQKRIDAMSDEELRRRIKILVEQTEREEVGWTEMSPEARQPGMIGGYLYAIEIYRLLGIGVRGSQYDALEREIERGD